MFPSIGVTVICAFKSKVQLKIVIMAALCKFLSQKTICSWPSEEETIHKLFFGLAGRHSLNVLHNLLMYLTVGTFLWKLLTRFDHRSTQSLR